MIVEKTTIKERVADLRQNFGKIFRQGLVDQFDPIRKLDYRAYMMARMSKATDGGLEAMMLYGTLYLQDGALNVRNTGGLLKLLQNLQGEHDRFFAWIAGNRAEQLKKEGRENLFTDDDISALKDLNKGAMEQTFRLDLGGGKIVAETSREKLYKVMHHRLNEDYMKGVLDIAEKTGLIDKESRAVWEKDFYVAFYRAMEEGAGPSMKSGLVNNFAFKKLKGGKTELRDLLANTLRNWSHLLSASMKNQAARATLEAAVNVGAAIEVPSSHIGKQMGLDTSIVSILDDGVKRYFMVEDPMLLDAIMAMDSSEFKGPMMKALKKFKYWLTFGVTANPAFRIRNLMRDTVSAIAQSELSYNPFKNVAHGWKAAGHDSPVRASMMASGGLVRFGTMLEGDRAEHVKRLIESGVDESTILDKPHKVKAMLQKMWDGYQEHGDRFENANRAALYEQLRAQGKDHLEASFGSRDLLDFSMQGKWTAVRFLSQTVPFFNARLQGMYKLGRAAVKDRRRMGYVVGAATLASIALLLWNADDDDWKKREEWDRDNFWWFKVGDVAFRIPKPFEIGAVASIAERALEWIISNERDAGKRFAKRVGAIVSDNLSMNPVPQFAKPLIDLYANKDSFTGRPLETMGMERLSKDERVGRRTTLPAQLLAKLEFTNTLSPVQIDHLVRSYFGWVGTAALTSIDYFITPLSNAPRTPTLKLRDVFLAGNFVETLPANQSRYVTAFYEQAKEIEEAYNDYRNALRLGDIERADRIRRGSGDKIALHGRVAGIKSALTNLNAAESGVYASRSMDAKDKRERIDALEEMRNRIAKSMAAR